MAIDPEKFKRDPRTPAELAAEILDYPITPPSPSASLRRHLIAGITSNLVPPVSPHFSLLFPESMVPALKRIEEDVPLDERDKRALSYSLCCIDAYKANVAECRDHIARQSRAPDDPENFAYYDPEEDKDAFKRWQADLVETWTLEIGNLNQVEKLLRTLADKLGISLTEPGRGK